MAAIRSGATPGPTPNPYRQPSQQYHQQQRDDPNYPDYLRDVPAPDYANLQQQGQGQGQGQGQYGQPAKRTMPVAHEMAFDDEYYLPSFDEDLKIQIRGTCRHCDGTGTLDGELVRCRVCRNVWTRKEVEMVGKPRFMGWGRWTELPCRHTIKDIAQEYFPPQCQSCGGDGRRTIWIPWNDFLDLLTTSGTADASEAVTEAIRTLSQASQAHHRDEFARSGEPTAPPVSPVRHTPTPDYYQQQQQRHTPNPYSPHMAPLTPHVVTPLRPEDSDARRF